MRRQTFLRQIARVAIVCAPSLGAAASSQVQAPPQFRAGVTLVPVVVRVVDRAGQPVTDLKAGDFTIRDGAHVQKVELFETVALDGSSTAVGRTFLIVLGRGRLNAPTNAIQALMRFVQTQALPQDRIGVVAYLRAIEPTIDHPAIVRFLDAYRERHLSIEGLLIKDRMRPAMGLLRPLSAETRTGIEGLLATAGVTVRNLAGAEGIGADQYGDFTYVKNSLEFLRTIDGEKHAIVVSERPPGVGPVEDNPLKNFWFRLATAARASMWYIHAGGPPAAATPTSTRPRQLLTGLHPGIVAAYKQAAEQTGGLAAFFEFADRPLTALDRSTRFHYLLGYYPSEPLTADAYRRITVSIARPGLRLLYRQGYVAQPAPESPEEYRQVAVNARVEMAAWHLVNPIVAPSSDRGFRWEMRLKSPVWRASGEAGAGEVRVTVSFDPMQVSFVKDGDAYLTDLDFVLLADDDQRTVIGEQKLRLNLRLSETDLARTKREWVSYDATVQTRTRPRYLRAVLYEFKQDRIASTQVRVPG